MKPVKDWMKLGLLRLKYHSQFSYVYASIMSIQNPCSSYLQVWDPVDTEEILHTISIRNGNAVDAIFLAPDYGG
jgi:hypothetical protein